MHYIRYGRPERPQSRVVAPIWTVVFSCVAGYLGAFTEPITAAAVEVQRTTLPQATTTSGFLTIDFVSDVFVVNNVTPVVLAMPATTGGHPCNIRFSDVRQDGFDAACVEAPGRDGPHLPMDLHYIAIEPGVHAIPATVGGVPTIVTIAVGTVSTSAVQHGCASIVACGVEGSTAITFGATFATPPSLLLQIQSLNSESSSPPATVSTPFLTATVVEDGAGNPIISTSGATVALERSEVQQGTVVAETLGWLAVAPTTGCTILDLSGFGGPASVPFEAFVTGELIDGWDNGGSNGCNAGEGASFTAGCFASPPAVVATKRSRNEDDGGWLRRCTNSNTATTVRLTIDEDMNSGGGNQGDNERSHVDESASVVAFGADFFTPVTLDSIHGEHTERGLRVRWTTATEVGNVGFRVFAVTPEGWVPLRESIVPSQAAGSLESQTYNVTFDDPNGRWRSVSAIGIASIDLRGRRQDFGPFALEQRHGLPHPRVAVDWPTIVAEHAAEADRLDAQVRREVSRGDDLGRALEIHVSETGLYRIHHDELVAAGLDLTGVPMAEIALRSAAIARARRIETTNAEPSFGPGAWIEFWGEAVSDSLHTQTNVYQLTVDGRHALAMATDTSLPVGPVPDAYDASVEDAENRHYSFASPTGDPWFSYRILAFTTPVTESVALDVDALALIDKPARLDVVWWGSTDFPAAPDHHVVMTLNGHLVWEGTSDGLDVVKVGVEVPAAIVREGVNQLEITVPGDTGVPFDLVHVESVQLIHSRRFVARDDGLRFRARGAALEVTGLPEPSVSVYRLGAGRGRAPTLVNVIVDADGQGGFRARFAGTPSLARSYAVTPTSRLRTPDRMRLVPSRPLPLGEGQLMIIAHGHFVEGLGDFVAQRRSDGFSVTVVDVETVYQHHSHGIVDPEAIRAFIAESVARRGTEFVLLVGGDTNDPLGHTGTGSMSFLPTPYVATDDLIRFTPADALLADVDGDDFPDVPIGRWPVRTQDELATVIAKTLRFASAAPHDRAVFAADDREPMSSFSAINESMIATLPPGWTVDRVELDALDPTVARDRLVSLIEANPAVTSFVGHSGPAAWTFDGLLNVSHVRALRHDEPTVVFQWGCWNTYHVDPTYDTMGHAFLLNDQGGAAAVLGAATLTTVESERLLGPLVLERALAGDQSIGAAMQAGKELLRQYHPERRDVLLGWTLLGDPTLEVNP